MKQNIKKWRNTLQVSVVALLLIVFSVICMRGQGRQHMPAQTAALQQLEKPQQEFLLQKQDKKTQQRRPVIGISSYAENNTAKVGMTYVKSVREAGGTALIIPLTTDMGEIDAVLDVIDGLLMTGGEDISPFYFGEEPHRNLGEIVPDRDLFDIALIRRAIERKIPILAICRGEQILNVAMGGSLYQDIPSQVPNALQHSQKAPRNYGAHSIKIDKNSLLYGLLATDSINVNSFHHQAVKEVAPGFKVTAVAKDGVVECIEKEDGMAVGVQFHPEGFVYSGDMRFLPLFQFLIDKAAARPRK